MGPTWTPSGTELTTNGHTAELRNLLKFVFLEACLGEGVVEQLLRVVWAKGLLKFVFP